MEIYTNPNSIKYAVVRHCVSSKRFQYEVVQEGNRFGRKYNVKGLVDLVNSGSFNLKFEDSSILTDIENEIGRREERKTKFEKD